MLVYWFMVVNSICVCEDWVYMHRGFDSVCCLEAGCPYRVLCPLSVSTKPRAYHVCYIDWPKPLSHSFLSSRAVWEGGFTNATSTPGFHMAPEYLAYLNSGPHGFTASTLPILPFLNSTVFVCLFVCFKPMVRNSGPGCFFHYRQAIQTKE